MLTLGGHFTRRFYATGPIDFVSTVDGFSAKYSQGTNLNNIFFSLPSSGPAKLGFFFNGDLNIFSNKLKIIQDKWKKKLSWKTEILFNIQLFHSFFLFIIKINFVIVLQFTAQF